MDSDLRTGRDGSVTTIIKGGLIGIANIIPGVSGGTFALILGIYDRLIGAVNAINLATAKVFLKLLVSGFSTEGRKAWADQWRKIDATFLSLLMLGAVVAIFSSSFLIEYLLTCHYSPTLAFFVGLILPSISIPWAMMERRGRCLLWIIPGIVITVGISSVMPDSTYGLDNPLMAFVTGAIAISAMILPGISGSYVMLIMGQYQNVLAKLTHLNAGALVWFLGLALGMGIGIVLFARLLHFLLARYRSATMAFLIGLLFGSLFVLWPFKDIASGAQVTGRDGEVKQEIQIATAPNRMPRTLSEGLIAAAGLFGGLCGSYGLIVLGRKNTKAGEAVKGPS